MTFGMSFCSTGIDVSNRLYVPRYSPPAKYTFVDCESNDGFGWGNVAGSGRKMSAASTMAAQVIGVTTVITRNALMPRSPRRTIAPSVAHGRVRKERASLRARAPLLRAAPERLEPAVPPVADVGHPRGGVVEGA